MEKELNRQTQADEENNFKRLSKSKSSIKRALTIFSKFVDNFSAQAEVTQQEIIKLKERIQRAENLLNEFNQYQNEIELLDSIDIDAQFKDREQFENSFYDAIASAKSLLETFNSENINNQLVSTETITKKDIVELKLPEISLPKFNGKLDNWLEFRDSFEGLIHSNNRLKNIQKFHYLRGALEGTARAAISKILYSEDNYEIAWATVCNRFNNKKKLIFEHIKALYSIETIFKATSQKLQNLVDDIYKHLGCIEQLGLNTENWDALLIFFITTRLDNTTRREWEKEADSMQGFPTIDQFLKFLQKSANWVDKLEYTGAINTGKIGGHSSNEQKFLKREFKKENVKSFVTSKYACEFCKKDHSLYKCDEFLQLSISEKKDFVRKSNLCYNCLRQGHSVKNCRLGPCKKCKAWHNSILHENKSETNTYEENLVGETGAVSLNAISLEKSVTEQVLLSTATILVKSQTGNMQKVRALLDCGSQTSFITHNLRLNLGIKTEKANLSVFGISNNISKVKERCRISVQSLHTSFQADINCYILQEISGPMPSASIKRKYFKIPDYIQLADPTFNEQGEIQILIGADLFWSIIGSGKISLGKHMPILQETELGWVVSGPLGISDDNKKVQCCLSTNQELLKAITKFWQIEELPETKILSPEEELCERNFVETTTREADGRFMVTFPLKLSPTNLGNSRKTAEKQFYSLEKRFMKNDLLYQDYKRFMSEYCELNHMSVSENNINEKYEYFMPHMAVCRDSSLTTKLRVVFNASAPSDNNLSLNNIQAVGPILQDDLLSIILRFRKHNYVMSADIAKMYRQVLIKPEFRCLQKIFWRDNFDEQLTIYNLNTVTYGQTSSSYLAVRCLVELANEIQDEKPEIADIIKHDFYVDDLLTGAETIEYAQKICHEISSVLSSGCFQLRKWISNDPSILKSIDSTAEHHILDFSPDEKTKTLGLIWAAHSDKLMYTIVQGNENSEPTRRLVLSSIAQIFDPLGILSPCTILVKILIQSLWQEKLNWDDVISQKCQDVWKKFQSELPLINNIKIERQAICKDAVDIQLHGFSDSSEKAYGACIYLRSIDVQGNAHVRLLCSKSRVAPIKTVSIPRLELCAALLLARLYSKVVTSLKVPFSKKVLWSDSTITLGWIKTCPSLLKTFVANRVSEILSLTEQAEWRFVSTHDNPADIVSRGLFPGQILNACIWWKGPIWLAQDSSQWPKERPQSNDKLPEIKTVCLMENSKAFLQFPFEKFSNFFKMQRVLAYMLRFKYNCLHKDSKRKNALTVQELNDSIIILIKICQSQSFFNELHQLKQNGKLDNKNRILQLTPFLDQNEILRVGGRLKHSEYDFDKKHPILLNSKHYFSKLLFEYEHKRLLHAGPQLLLSSIRETYWPIAGRNLARRTVKQCLRCFRFNATTAQPLMGNLPTARVQASSPFLNVGVDYAGPFLLKDKKGRGCKTQKCYVGVFVCFSTRAVHIELISDLSSEAFLQALYRFVSRRGKPSKIFSDNGTNFVGAKRELTNFLKDNGDNIAELVSNQSIEWSFIPPHSPHFGGIWEAAVKSVKYHLRRVLANLSLVFEEFGTILSQIEAILNSRPLTPLSSDPNDFTCLTPAHFLIGRSLIAAPNPNITAINPNRLTRFQLMQQVTQHFWQRWKNEYLSEMQIRTKWKSNSQLLKENALVLIKDDNYSPCHWKLGRITELHKGSDGIARVATIKTAMGSIKRGFQKICPLPITF